MRARRLPVTAEQLEQQWVFGDRSSGAGGVAAIVASQRRMDQPQLQSKSGPSRLPDLQAGHRRAHRASL